MKKFILCISITFLCGCGVNQKFLKAVEKNWGAIRPEYVQYVKEDEELSATEKDIKLFTVELFDEMIERAKE